MPSVRTNGAIFSVRRPLPIEFWQLNTALPHIKSIQKDSSGPIADMDPVTVMGLIGTGLGLQVLQKPEYEEYSRNLEEFDENIYDEIQDAMISMLARGLTISSDCDH